MDEQRSVDDIIQRIDTANCDAKSIYLTASKEVLTERMVGDIKKGLQAEDVLDRSFVRIPLYQKLNSAKIVTDGKTIQEIAHEIRLL